ncbi:MAG: YihY/virulence factor BrkB family protein [Lachnospiraceae bacterium]|nr:YihY/virulence factor BrkB family protein [Lachnospiraceae bacterium]
MLKRIGSGILSIWARVRKHHLFSFAATSAYFLLMSFIPFILILLVLVRYTTLSETDMMNVLISVMPRQLEKFVTVIVREVYTKSVAVVPVSVVIALWSAAKGFHALTYGLNTIYDVKEQKNWFYVRFRSMLYTLILAVILLGLLFLLVFGRGMRVDSEQNISAFMRFILTNRYVLSCIFMTVVFVFMYKVLPDRKMETIGQIPGAILVGIGWTGFSWFLSIFYSPSVMNTYGSLTAVILAMIWMYFCMYFFLIGAEINDILVQAPEDNLILTMVRDALYEFVTAKERNLVAEEQAAYLGKDGSALSYKKRISDIFKKFRKRKASI